MKNIIPCLNRVQLACQCRGPNSLTLLGLARKDLMKAIRETILEGMKCADGLSPEHTKFMAQFDKLNGD